jgi:hypothetical protein
MEAGPGEDIIGYGCDVGMKSLLRSVCEFYLQGISVARTTIPENTIETFVR